MAFPLFTNSVIGISNRDWEGIEEELTNMTTCVSNQPLVLSTLFVGNSPPYAHQMGYLWPNESTMTWGKALYNVLGILPRTGWTDSLSGDDLRDCILALWLEYQGGPEWIVRTVYARLCLVLYVVRSVRTLVPWLFGDEWSWNCYRSFIKGQYIPSNFWLLGHFEHAGLGKL